MSTVPLNPISNVIAIDDNREKASFENIPLWNQDREDVNIRNLLTFEFIDLSPYSKVDITNNTYFHWLVGIWS